MVESSSGTSGRASFISLGQEVSSSWRMSGLFILELVASLRRSCCDVDDSQGRKVSKVLGVVMGTRPKTSMMSFTALFRASDFNTLRAACVGATCPSSVEEEEGISSICASRGERHHEIASEHAISPFYRIMNARALLTAHLHVLARKSTSYPYFDLAVPKILVARRMRRNVQP